MSVAKELRDEYELGVRRICVGEYSGGRKEDGRKERLNKNFLAENC